MGTAAEPGAQQQPLRVDMTMEEIERGSKEADAQAKAEADAKAAEAAKAAAAAAAADDPKVSALKEALRLSEESRRKLEADVAARTAVPAAPTEPAPKELSREELAELMTKDPLAAIDYMTARSARTVEENVSKRLQPLLSGSRSTVEDMARSKYPDEFKIFGDEITKFVESAPDKSVFSVMKNWDDLIAWTRGRPGNFEKLIEHRTEQGRAKAAADAQAAQIASAGAHARNDTRAPAPTTGGALDETERAIVKELAASGILDRSDPEGDYKKWRGVAR